MSSWKWRVRLGPLKAALSLASGLVISQSTCMAADLDPRVRTNYACAPGQESSKACQAARSAAAQAERNFLRQQDRVRAAQDLVRLSSELPETVSRVPAAITAGTDAWSAVVASASELRGAAMASSDSCGKHEAAVADLRRSASAFRAAAVGFATAPASQAKDFASRADAARDALQSARATLAAASKACVQDVNHLVGAQEKFQSAERGFGSERRALSDLAAGLGRQAARGTDDLMQHASRIQAPLTQAFASTSRLAAALQPPGVSDAAAREAALATSVQMAVQGIGSPSVRQEPAIDAALEENLVALDAESFGQATQSSWLKQCNGESACVAALEGRGQSRRQATEATGVRLDALLTKRRTALDSFASLSKDLDPKTFDFELWTRTLQGLPRDLDLKTRPDWQGMAQVLTQEVQQERQKQAQLRKVLERAELRAYGRVLERESLGMGSASSAASEQRPVAMAMSGIAADHAHQFISATVPELPDFAAYTYVYLPDRSNSSTVRDRYLNTLSAVVEKSVRAGDVPSKPLERGRFNLMCVPNRNAKARNAEDDKPGAWLVDEYDIGFMEHLLLSSHSGAVLRHLVTTRQGGGPYLLTTRKQLNLTRSGDWLLFVDLSNVPQGYARDMVLGYMKRFNEPPPQVLGGVETEEWQPSLAQKTFMSLSTFTDVLASLQKQTGFNISKALGGGSEGGKGSKDNSATVQSFVSIGQ